MRGTRRKWIRRAAFGLLTLLVVAVAGVTLEWYSTRWKNERLLAEAVARLDAADPGWRLRELSDARNARLPPPERNAGAQIVAAMALAPPAFAEWRKGIASPPEPVSNRLPDADADAARALAALHAGCAEALKVARRVRALPDGGFALRLSEPNPVATPLPHLTQLRDGAFLLALDAAVHAHDKRPGEALEACHAILNVASGGVGDEPLIIAQLVRMAVTMTALSEIERTLAWNEGPAGLAELQARLAAEREVPRLAYAYRGDRAVFSRVFDNLDAGTLTLDDLFNPREPRGWRGRLMGWDVRKEYPKAHARLLDHFDAMLASAALPDPARAAAVAVEAGRVPPLREQSLNEGIHHLFLTGSDRINPLETLLRARLGCAVAALACERFRQKAGRWPKSLAELPPELLAAVADPYTGKPLLYRAHAEGVAVYATGADLIDNGGTNLAEKDGPGADVGFRLWNPDLRRAAPFPPEVPE